MSGAMSKNPEIAGEKKDVPFATQFTVDMPSGSVTKGIFQPGWKWSTHIKPMIGGELCQEPHFGVVIEGSLTILQDGVETICNAGDVVHATPGHDAWVNGNQTVVLYEFAQTNLFAHKK